MHLLHRLSGQRADPTGTPTKHSSAKERAEETRNCILKATAHHPDTREDETAQADDCACVHGKRFERPHERLCPGEVHRSLCVRNGRDGESEKAGEQDSKDPTNSVRYDRPACYADRANTLG